jgi:hypothetical protein
MHRRRRPLGNQPRIRDLPRLHLDSPWESLLDNPLVSLPATLCPVCLIPREMMLMISYVDILSCRDHATQPVGQNTWNNDVFEEFINPGI